MHEWPSEVSYGECDGSRTLFYEDISLNATGSSHNAIHIHNFNNSEPRVVTDCRRSAAFESAACVLRVRIVSNRCLSHLFVESISHIKFKLDELLDVTPGHCSETEWAQFTSFASETLAQIDSICCAPNDIDDRYNYKETVSTTPWRPWLSNQR